MAAGPATPMRYAVPNSTVTQNDERNHHNRHKDPDQKSIGLAIKIILLHAKYCGDHIATTPSQLCDTRSHAPHAGISVQKDCVRRLTSNFYAGRQDTLATNTPLREKAPTITHIESRTDQNGNLQTLETQIA